jgi:hypothetical protein
MATPGQLVNAMATALGIPAATITQYDRQLAESGLRSKGGRGTSAAKVTARDAANLLIAVVASPISGPSVKVAVRTCETYGSLPVLGRASHRNFVKFGLPRLDTLPKRHTLREALSALFEGSSRGEFFKIFIDRRPITDADLFFGITFQGPVPWAGIDADASIGQRLPGQTARLVYTRLKPLQDRTGDLNQERTISFATIRLLGALLALGDR